MDIRPIATNKDYEAALAEIKRLWSAGAGSPEAQKLEVLAMLAQNYERAREPLPRAVGSSRVDLQACKLEYSIVSPK